MLLPDCTYCGSSVVLAIDIDGAVEECTGCGLAQRIVHEVLPPAAVKDLRRAIRQVKRQHRACIEQRCKCLCHMDPRRL